MMDIKKAVLSDDMVHRYTLTRVWEEDKPFILFIGLNPSRADHEFNDPTITRCINFAKEWGYGGMNFGNLYSFRTPYVKTVPPDAKEVWEPLLKNLRTAYNSETDFWLRSLIVRSEKVVCAWGSWNFIDNRVSQVLAMIDKPYCFGKNRDGQPKHPLYLSSKSQLQIYEHN